MALPAPASAQAPCNSCDVWLIWMQASLVILKGFFCGIFHTFRLIVVEQTISYSGVDFLLFVGNIHQLEHSGPLSSLQLQNSFLFTEVDDMSVCDMTNYISWSP